MPLRRRDRHAHDRAREGSRRGGIRVNAVRPGVIYTDPRERRRARTRRARGGRGADVARRPARGGGARDPVAAVLRVLLLTGTFIDVGWPLRWPATRALRCEETRVQGAHDRLHHRRAARISRVARTLEPGVGFSPKPAKPRGGAFLRHPKVTCDGTRAPRRLEPAGFVGSRGRRNRRRPPPTSPRTRSARWRCPWAWPMKVCAVTEVVGPEARHPQERRPDGHRRIATTQCSRSSSTARRRRTLTSDMYKALAAALRRRARRYGSRHRLPRAARRLHRGQRPRGFHERPPWHRFPVFLPRGGDEAEASSPR